MGKKFVQQLSDIYETGKVDGAKLMERRTLDYVTIALGRMGFGEVRLEKFNQTLGEVWDDYGALIKDDAQNDSKEFAYFRSTIDRELQQYCGSKFIPYEERYAYCAPMKGFGRK